MASPPHHHNQWVLVFGLLGNIVSFIVFLAPVPTFYRICKKKSTEGFQSTPYVAALFSAMLWIYYASLKKDEMLLMTINSFGLFIETLYLAIFITFATKQARIFTLRFLFLLNFGGFCFILLLSHFIANGSNRVRILGGISVAFTVTVFVAPLSIMRVVIRTKSVEFMPFSLSFFLTLSAVVWLLYGVSLGDFYVAFPNVLGFTFGVAQMILYAIYRNKKPVIDEKLPQHKVDVVMVTPTVLTSITSPDDDQPHDQDQVKQEDLSRPSAVDANTSATDGHHGHTRDITYDYEQKSKDSFAQGPLAVKCEA